MRFSMLASGSTGNALYIETNEARLLVDAGLSGRQLEQLLAEHRVGPDQLDAILISHEHIDHVKGVGVLARRYQLPVYANRSTWEAIPAQVGEIPEAQCRIFETGKYFRIGDLEIESFPTSHDAAEPVGFCFYHGEMKLGLATDLGYMSRKVMEKLRDSHILILEANHDVEMLRMSRYPWEVKRRILSDTGHLSNESAGDALLEILKMGSTIREVFLAHLSQENNLQELAHLTVEHCLRQEQIEVGKELRLAHTFPDRPTPLQDVTG
jgi:phosphoribosyl 1,2-cyclic phosphodiesterase